MTIAYAPLAPDYARHREGYGYVIVMLERLFERSPGESVLEVGCGTGVYTAAMAESGASMIYGMDLSRRILSAVPSTGTADGGKMLLSDRHSTGNMPWDGSSRSVFCAKP